MVHSNDSEEIETGVVLSTAKGVRKVLHLHRRRRREYFSSMHLEAPGVLHFGENPTHVASPLFGLANLWLNPGFGGIHPLLGSSKQIKSSAGQRALSQTELAPHHYWGWNPLSLASKRCTCRVKVVAQRMDVGDLWEWYKWQWLLDALRCAESMYPLATNARRDVS